jgi:hypothetical protein
MPPAEDLKHDNLPIYGTAELCAQLEHQQHGPISPRTIREAWGLEWRVINGRAVTHIPTFLAVAQSRFDASRVVASTGRNISVATKVTNTDS